MLTVIGPTANVVLSGSAHGLVHAIDAAIARRQCTFSVTRNRYVRQKFRCCNTCSFVNGASKARFSRAANHADRMRRPRRLHLVRGRLPCRPRSQRRNLGRRVLLRLRQWCWKLLLPMSRYGSRGSSAAAAAAVPLILARRLAAVIRASSSGSASTEAAVLQSDSVHGVGSCHPIGAVVVATLFNSPELAGNGRSRRSAEKVCACVRSPGWAR